MAEHTTSLLDMRYRPIPNGRHQEGLRALDRAELTGMRMRRVCFLHVQLSSRL
jgi:hypothetical protein